MAKIILHAHKAYSNPRYPGVVTIIFNIGRSDNTLPARREADVRNTAEALAALDAYAKECEATGLSLCVSVMLARGERSPNGFGKADTKRYVNLQPEPETV